MGSNGEAVNFQSEGVGVLHIFGNGLLLSDGTADAFEADGGNSGAVVRFTKSEAAEEHEEKRNERLHSCERRWMSGTKLRRGESV